MAQEPKKKHSKARKRTRRASIVLGKFSTIKCPNCKAEKLPHQVCLSCGFYNGKAVKIKTEVKVTKVS